jgi:hypothetical protein
LPEYYPKNIFGLPDTSAGLYSQSASPENVCSLGLGGQIVVGFKDNAVYDGPGPDFTIFENAFLNPATNKIFAEPAIIEVSQDAVNYFLFPFDSLTLKGCAGITPIYGNKDPFNPEESGGDKFDLSDIGLDYIRYIRITDISEMILDNPSHPYYDPTITGFDLDAVVGLNLRKTGTSVNTDIKSDDFSFHFDHERNAGLLKNNMGNRNNSYYIYSVDGSLVLNGSVDNEISLDLSNFADGMYLIVLRTKEKTECHEFFKY